MALIMTDFDCARASLGLTRGTAGEPPEVSPVDTSHLDSSARQEPNQWKLTSVRGVPIPEHEVISCATFLLVFSILKKNMSDIDVLRH